MQRTDQWIRGLGQNGLFVRAVAGVAVGTLCVAIFVRRILKLPPEQTNSSHVLILGIGLIAFFIPWIDKLSFSKDGLLDISFFRDAIESLDKKIDMVSKLPDDVQNVQQPREISALRASKASFGRQLNLRNLAETLDYNTLVQIDPNKGEFGGESTSESASISAKVEPVSDSWYQITITVKATEGKHLPPGNVTFYLHPTFAEPKVTAPVANDTAVLRIGAWGSFTVGAELANGETLELDLSKVRGVPRGFID